MNKDVPKDGVQPSTEREAFNCPHCGVYTHQFWWRLHAKKAEHSPVPYSKIYENLKDNDKIDIQVKSSYKQKADLENQGLVFMDQEQKDPFSYGVNNLHISECFTCKKLAVWADKRLLVPHLFAGQEANYDLPDEIKKDFNEARAILNISPRGSAALLRLCVQKLCHHLECNPDDTINNNISDLVKRGLDPSVQKSLDIVRVVGNDAVHPGVLDLNDNTDVAVTLFGLVNLIADVMISQPKHINSVYESLPQEKRDAIMKRDQSATEKKTA